MKVSTAVAAGLGVAAGAAAVARASRVEMSLQGKAALVTGGSRGLGLLIARELVREDCRVAIVARDRAELERAQALLEAEGGQVLSLVADVADSRRIKEVVDTAIAHFGGLDVLVNNAGVIQVGPVAAMSHDDFRLCLDVMFWGVLNPTLAALDHMRERGSGRIVNVTSIGGKVAAPHILPYATAKFAAVALSEGLRAELARDGISVTTVVPGLMRTGSYLNAYFKGDLQREFVWFSLGDNLPFVSMDAERAARRIVLAAKRGEPELTLTLLAKVAARAQGLMPGLTADVLGVVNRFLPSASATAKEREMTRGLQIEGELHSRVFERVTSMGRTAAKRFNQLSTVGADGAGSNGL